MDDRNLDRAFEVLAGQQRRHVVEKFRATADGVTSVDDLADHLVGRTSEATDRKQAETTLYHRILPKLDEPNLIDFDPRTDTVRYHGDEQIEDLLDVVATQTE